MISRMISGRQDFRPPTRLETETRTRATSRSSPQSSRPPADSTGLWKNGLGRAPSSLNTFAVFTCSAPRCLRAFALPAEGGLYPRLWRTSSTSLVEGAQAPPPGRACAGERTGAVCMGSPRWAKGRFSSLPAWQRCAKVFRAPKAARSSLT